MDRNTNKRNKSNICTFYRPPKDAQGFQLDELDQALSKLGNKINTQNVIIMGDFNLPNIDWGNHAIKPNSGYSTIAANKLLTIMEEHGLTQHVRIPTPTQGNSSNILDLVLTNRPDLIKKLSVVDGVADHNSIVIDINILPKRKCRPKRKMFLRNKADNASILKHLDNFKHEYSVLNDNMSVNDRWNIVTSKVTDIINTCVPHCFTSSRHNLPWFTKNLKKLCKRKQRLYNKAKKTRNQDDWKSSAWVRVSIG